MGEYCLAVDVGGTKILYGLFDRSNRIVYRIKTYMPRETTQQQLTEKIYTEITTLLAHNQLSTTDLRGIGIGMPSYVDYERGIVISSGSMMQIKNYPAKALFSERFPGVPVLVDNDTNLAALAEWKLGAGQHTSHIVYTALSTGIGSGFIINGELFRGSYGGAGESGHMLVTPGEGVLCGCGNRGCIMSYASGTMIMKHVREAIARGEPTLLAQMEDDPLKLNATHLSEAYQQGDPLAIRMLGQMVHYIGMYFYNLFISFNIGCYICGGGLLNMGDFFLEQIREKVSFFNQQENQQIEIKQAQLGADNGIIGAAMLFASQQEGVHK